MLRTIAKLASVWSKPRTPKGFPGRMSLILSDFDYRLPPEMIAQKPLQRRDDSRLMVLNRRDGSLSHRMFRDLPELLRGGDLLVLNDTRVVPARLAARRRTGARIAGLFLRELALGEWEVMLRGAGRCRPGEPLELAAGLAEMTLRENLGSGAWRVSIAPAAPAAEMLEHAGGTPLPHYIRRPSGAKDDAADRERYQTVYAASPGAVAAPTAGLHFTPELLDGIREKGAETCAVTLHVGVGTFAPVKTQLVSRHRMHKEWYRLDSRAAEAVNLARRRGGRVVAVGTTALRVLETAARSAASDRKLEPSSGWTDLFIYPPADFLAAGALITNFHLPRSTLLMLAAAFCSPGSTEGVAMILSAYRQAVEAGYRFYSYGDAMLIE